MERTRPKMQLPLVDDLFSTQEERSSINQEKVVEIAINEIVGFANHPFKVIVNSDLENMVESIQEYGVLSPVLVRAKNGKYEMISGHRRKKASELARLTTLPCIVRDLTDDEATIIMVDSNLQREELLPSERAFAYKMKYEAIKHQGKRTDLTSGQVEQKLTTRDEIGKEHGDSGATVRRYIRLTELVPEILEKVDEGKIAISPAVEISYLAKEEQLTLLDVMQYTDATPSVLQAQQLKKLSQEGKLTEEEMQIMLEQEKPNQIPKIQIGADRLRKILPKNLKSDKEIEDFVIKCVEEYAKRSRQKSIDER